MVGLEKHLKNVQAKTGFDMSLPFWDGYRKDYSAKLRAWREERKARALGPVGQGIDDNLRDLENCESCRFTKGSA